jgi:Yip1 domain
MDNQNQQGQTPFPNQPNGPTPPPPPPPQNPVGDSGNLNNQNYIPDRGFVQAVIGDALMMITSPKQYFAQMKRDADYKQLAIKGAIYGFIAGALMLVATFLTTKALISATMTGVMYLIMSVIGVFFSGLFILLLSIVCGGNNAYKETTNLSASLMGLMPLYSAGFLLQPINAGLPMIFMGIVGLYGVYLLYIAGITFLSVTRQSLLKIFMGIFAVLQILSVFGGVKIMMRGGGSVPNASSINENYSTGGF